MLTLPSKAISLSMRVLVLSLAVVSSMSHAAPEMLQADTSELDNILWEDGNDLPAWSRLQVQGGKYTSLIGQLPNHWRRFGPDTPNALTPVLESLNLPLLGLHPLEGKVIPMLASHWFHDVEAQRFYYRIDERALWSDGIPVTSSDIVFTLFFLTDPRRMAPYQSQLIDKMMDRVTVYDPSHFSIDYTLAATLASESLTEDNTLDANFLLYALRPMPAHHYQSGQTWLSASELAIMPIVESTPEPVTGPYIPTVLDDEHVQFKRIEQWWGETQRYLANRFALAEVTLLEFSEKSFKRFSEGTVDVIESNNSIAMKSSWLDKIAMNYQISRASIALDSPDQVLLITNNRVPEVEFQNINDQLARLYRGDISVKETNFGVELIYPAGEEFAWLKNSKKTQALDSERYRFAIQTSHYDAALLVVPHSTISSLPHLFSLSLTDKSVAVVYDIPYHHYAYWNWVNLPSPSMALGNKDWFSPFDAVRGGMITVDRKHKANMLNKPIRKNKDTPGIILYPANLTQ